MVSVAVAAVAVSACGATAQELDEPRIGDTPALAIHTSQAAIENGSVELAEVAARGKALFEASFNSLDGAGRPETTDTSRSNFRERREFPQNFNRISGPDANSCSACHGLPRVGGGGDNATNVFVLADRHPFVNFDAGKGDSFEEHSLTSVGDERNALGLFGSGFIEMLAREMTVQLQGIEAEARKEAKSSGAPAARELVAKGVDFGQVTVRPDGTVDTSQVEGVDSDLIIKPFMQKAAVVSLREFSVKAMNQHFGMQASERFRDGVDADGDGLVNEITRGDITALVMFQATLPAPGEVRPDHPKAQAAVERGRDLFETVGCTMCHIPELRLDNPIFSEPSPFNPPDKLQVSDVSNPVLADLTSVGTSPHMVRESDGSVLVPVFTDLKRHKMGDALNNEMMEQAGIATDEWLTRKLWGFASEPPFLHHGRATLISEAVLAHGGEAEESRQAFAALPQEDQAAIVEFLKTLRILPEGPQDLAVAAAGTRDDGPTRWAVVAGSLAVTLLAVAAIAGIAAWRKGAFRRSG